MATAPPFASICIPTYNAADYLEVCLNSALAQTYPNIEILISDDGSTDSTLAIVEKYQQVHPGIRLVKGPGSGMVNNWNNCIEQAKGEWIKFLFQDDVLQPACVEKLLAACLEHKVEVGLCRRQFIVHDDVPKYIRRNIKYTMVLPERFFEDKVYISPELLATELAELLPENVLGEPTCYLFNKHIFTCTGMFNSEYKHAVDLEFILRLGLLKGLVFLAEPLVQYRVHGKSQTSANISQKKDAAVRNIAAFEGDTMLLYYQFLHDPSFRLMKEAIGEEVLRLKINYIYYNGCKHKGKKAMNEALLPLRKKYRELGAMNYNLFKYIRARKQYKDWLKQNR